MEIIYSDNDIVVCIKPKGVLSAKDLSGKANMADLLADGLSVLTVYPVHRLDKDVSGLMVFALNQTSAARLSADAADHTRFIKEYIAIVSGCPETDEGIFEDLLFKDSRRGKSFVVDKMRVGVKKAKLSYSVRQKLESKTAVRVRLYTGRTHQIRVQFAYRGMPLIGDRKYGGAPSEKGIALFSCRISFYHPKTGEKLSFEKIPQISEMI